MTTSANGLLHKRRPDQYRTLVLNADARPLSTWPLSLIPAQDAVHAFYRDRVSVVENWDDIAFHSPSVTIPVPKVVMLREYAPVSGVPKFCRRSILLRDSLQCQYCGEGFESQELTFDHLIPRAAGGKTTWANILTCCIECNAKKAASMPNFSGRKGKVGKDGSMRPLKIPRQPTTAELLRNGLRFLSNDIKEDFGSYLWWGVELLP